VVGSFFLFNDIPYYNHKHTAEGNGGGDAKDDADDIYVFHDSGSSIQIYKYSNKGAQ
jgi:hypothetical protein